MMRCAFILMFALFPGLAWGQTGLVADISERTIEIRYSFSGAHLLLFGAIKKDAGLDVENPDIVVVVRGPAMPVVVRRKERIAGIWVNMDSLTFINAPGYYAVASTRPLDEIADRRTLRTHEIGFNNIQLAIQTALDAEEYNAFRSAFIRNKGAEGLFFSSTANVTLAEDVLFRTDVELPANVPVGSYAADVYLFQDGQLLGSHSTDLVVDKSGFERAVYDLAHMRPALYGLLAIFIAVAAGWTAGTLARH